MNHLVAIAEPDGRLAAGLRGENGVEWSELAAEFDWTVSAERVCVGSWDDDGHKPCPRRESVGDDAVCRACSGLEHPQCIFEPLCQSDPAACSCPFGPVPHVVYAAFFGTLAKVGMTQRRRVETRLREQGADAWFTIQAVPSRAEARLLERQVSMLFRIPEYRTHREVLPQLARPVPWEKIDARAAELRLRLESRYDVERSVHRVDSRLAQPLPAVPHRVMPEGRHVGRWLGAKGNHLFYASATRRGHLAPGAVHALPRNALLGRYIS